MFVLEIALGIVLAWVVISNFGLFFSIMVLSALAVIGLLFAWGSISWFSDNPIVLLLILGLMVLFYIWRIINFRSYESSYEGRIKFLERVIERRQFDGYDVEVQKKEVEALRDELKVKLTERANAEKEAIASSPYYLKQFAGKRFKISARAKKNESARRKRLGYDK